MIKNIMKRQVFFHITEYSNTFCFVLFLRKRLLHFQFYLFMQEKVQLKLAKAAVRKCTLYEAFLKIYHCLPKTPVFDCFFNKTEDLKACIFIKKSFDVNTAKFLKTAFLWKIFCLLWFYVMIEFFGRPWFYMACTVAVFRYNSSVRIEAPYLFRTCFYIIIFSKRNFRRHCNAGSNTILIKQLKIRNNCRTLMTSPRNLL